MKTFKKRVFSVVESSHFMLVVVTLMVTSFVCHVTAQENGGPGNNDDATQGTCQEDTCVHGACNTNTSSDVTCVCEGGWTGVACNEVSGLIGCDAGLARCRKTELCVQSGAGYTCVCKPGYDGKDCQREVTQVYGGQLSFQALEDVGQGWSRDLEDLLSKPFQVLAGRLENAVSGVLEKKEVFHIGVTVLKFTQQDDISGVIAARYQVSSNKPVNTTAMRQALDAGFSRCQGLLCQFGTDDDVIFGAVNDGSILQDNYNLCDDVRNNGCHDASTQCVTTNGTATCRCRSGFEPWTLSDNACEDVDECQRGSKREVCGTSGGTTLCHNTPGSYHCTCPNTHTWDSQLSACIWSNICKRDDPCLNDAKCDNTMDRGQPGFLCRCTYGWTGRVCGTVDPEAQVMLWTVVGLAVTLGCLCLMLIAVAIYLCCRRIRQGGKPRSALGHHHMGDTLPSSTLHSTTSPAMVVKATQGSVSSGYVMVDSPTPSLSGGVTSGVVSGVGSGKRRESTSGYYELGFTPPPDLTHLTLHKDKVKPAVFYSNTFMTDRL